MASRLPLHPFLIALYLVLRLVAENPAEARLGDAVRAGVMMLGGVALVVLALRFALGRVGPAAVWVSAALLLTWSFGVVRSMPIDLGPAGSDAALYWTLFGIWLAALTATTVLVFRYRELADRFDPVLNAMAGVLLLFPITQIGLEFVRGDFGPPGSSSTLAAVEDPVELEPGGEGPPDIYLIVLDGYARADVLQEFYGYDNGPFIEALGARGFQVAPRSHSNYLSTRLVMPSLLNFRTLDYLARRMGRDSKDLRPLVESVRRNRSVAALRGAGYRIVSIMTGMDHAALDDPDEAFDYDSADARLNELETVLLGMTPFLELLDRTLPQAALSQDELRRRRVEYALDQLATQGSRPGPKLVYAHILSPHDPFVFGPNGEKRSVHMDLFRAYPPARMHTLGFAYASQIQYLNTRVLETLDRILEESETEPIVVLLGDHGLRLRLRWNAKDTCLRESFAILYALRLPGREQEWLDDVVSPVNAFRMIFDAYFGTDLGRVPDRAYFAHRSGYYNHVDVTEQVETCSTPGP